MIATDIASLSNASDAFGHVLHSLRKKYIYFTKLRHNFHPVQLSAVSSKHDPFIL